MALDCIKMRVPTAELTFCLSGVPDMHLALRLPPQSGPLFQLTDVS